MFRSIAEARLWDFSLDILVVDPEAEIRLVFFVAADQVGCNVQFAESGSEALYQLTDKPDFDLIFAASGSFATLWRSKVSKICFFGKKILQGSALLFFVLYKSANPP